MVNCQRKEALVKSTSSLNIYHLCTKVFFKIFNFEKFHFLKNYFTPILKL